MEARDFSKYPTMHTVAPHYRVTQSRMSTTPSWRNPAVSRGHRKLPEPRTNNLFGGSLNQEWCPSYIFLESLRQHIRILQTHARIITREYHFNISFRKRLLVENDGATRVAGETLILVTLPPTHLVQSGTLDCGAIQTRLRKEVPERKQIF